MEKNHVIEGKHKGSKIDCSNTRIWVKSQPYSRTMNKLSISSYTVIDEFNK